MEKLSLEQMESVNGGRISWNSVGCSIGIGLIFGIAALGGPAGVGIAALAVTSGGAILCSAFYD
jgi:hypothetical protein